MLRAEYNLKQMLQVNFLERIKHLFKTNYYINESGKIERQFIDAEYEGPWIYKNVKPTSTFLNCIKWHHVVFGCFGCIPRECFSCYKVVVRPRNIIELLALNEVQEELDVPCKCGTEIREYVTAMYGGYFYTNSLEEGKERYNQVRKLVDERISPDTPVYLKRACTEFEVKFGDSDKWVVDPNEKFYSKWIDEHFEDTCFRNDYKQTDYIKLDTILRWVKYAAQNGDMSYLELTDGEPMFELPITYHEGE